MLRDFQKGLPPYDWDRLAKKARELILQRGEVPTSLLVYKVMIIVRKQEIRDYMEKQK